MTQLSLQIPQVNQPDATEDPKIASNFTAIQNVINGNLDTSNLAAGTVDGRGFANIPTSESRSNTAFGTLATPDQVTGVVLPANGLIAVWYQATWQESVSGAGAAAIFIGSNQLKIAVAAGSPSIEAASINKPGYWVPLIADSRIGLVSGNGGNADTTADVSTGQLVGATLSAAVLINYGGPAYIFAAAGTYTVSIQFKASSGSVTAKNRQLWVRSMAFS